VCCIDIWTICVHLEFGLRCSCWVIFMVVYTHEITCFRGGVLSWNTIFSMCLWYSHEINFMRVTLTKYQTLTKSFRDGDLSRNSAKYCHENTDANLVATLFSWGWLSCTPTTKWIRGGELSWKWDFHESIIVRGDAWRCTLTHYFCGSKTVFRDVFCPLTKSLVSGRDSMGYYCLMLQSLLHNKFADTM
jgi:hypothetical protein